MPLQAASSQQAYSRHLRIYAQIESSERGKLHDVVHNGGDEEQ